MSDKFYGRARPREYRCGHCGAPARKSGSNLGTWHCSRGCFPRGRFVTVARRLNAGHEGPNQGELVPVTVRRSILVEVKFL